jgi:hypothetical protein
MENIVLNDAELATVAGGYDDEVSLQPRQQGQLIPAVPAQPLIPAIPAIPDTPATSN